MGSSKKHKKDREPSSSAASTSISGAASSSSSKPKSKHKEKLRAPSPPSFRLESSRGGGGSRSDRDLERDRERERERERRHRQADRSREAAAAADKSGDRRRERSRERHHDAKSSSHSSGNRRDRNTATDYRSDDSDVVEVPMAPPAPKISDAAPAPPQITATSAASSSASRRSPSPIPENGAGDCLSIAETNKLRAKLGLKPLDLGDSGSGAAKPSAEAEPPRPRDPAHAHLAAHKDEWGEFLHKPAGNLASQLEAEKLREKIRQRKERRLHEERLKRVRKLGDEEDADDINAWLDRSRDRDRNRAEAAKRAAALAEQDDQMDEDAKRHEEAALRHKAYTDRHLRGLKVDHDAGDFGEGKTVILTLRDAGVLDEDGADTLVNVNMVDDERYKRSNANKKLNPNSYGYDVYEEQYDELGNPVDRNVLSKYDEEAGDGPRKAFTIGDEAEDQQQRQRRLADIKQKLAGRRLETLDEPLTRLASDTYTVDEMAAKFKKPKRKVKKTRQKLRPDDLLPLPGAQHHGRRERSARDSDDEPEEAGERKPEWLSDVKLEEEDDDLAVILAKARRLKQKEALISKSLTASETEVKQEPAGEGGEDEDAGRQDNNIILNATAEFCRTLGDIPTYGMSGNRDNDATDMMDADDSDNDDMEQNVEAAAGRAAAAAAAAAAADEERSTGTWNSVNPDVVVVADEAEAGGSGEGRGQRGGDQAILDEEPDVGSGMGAALKLALSKGYLEREDQNRPSNTRMAHLQAKNYSIEDKAHGDDDKFQRRDRFQHGPVSDFKEKDSYKPNVKLEYIDDSGRLLNEKEAFRYLSHKFHGKGPGKNKIEKRLKKNEQDGLLMKMSSTDTPLGTLTMLKHKQLETHSPYIVLSGSKQMQPSTSIVKHK